MRLSARELTLAVITLAVVLIAGTWMWAGPRLEQLAEVRNRSREYRSVIDRSQKLLAREDQWRDRLGRLRDKLPQYGADERVSASIMQMLQGRAAEAELSLLKATPQKERQVGELYEMSITYRWEGTLDSLVRFLYNLQSESVNLDIGQLSAGPASSTGSEMRLKGGFTVDVAYTRGSGGSPPVNKKDEGENKKELSPKKET